MNHVLPERMHVFVDDLEESDLVFPQPGRITSFQRDVAV